MRRSFYFHFRTIAFLTSSTMLLNTCSTPGKSQQSQRAIKKPAKTVVKVPQPTPRPTPSVQNDELAIWLVKMSQSETPFTIQDRQKVATMPPSPKPGSLAEAALVVGILRDIMTPPGGNEKFKEVDLNTTNTSKTDNNGVLPKPVRIVDNASVLEIRAREKGVDMNGALANNSLLKNISIFSWTWEAIALDGNSEIFKQNISTIIKSEAMLWQELAQKSGATQVAVAAPVLVPSPTPSPSPVAVEPSPSASAAPSDNQTAAVAMPAAEAEKLMVSAQDAAAKDNFAKAVADASKIPSTAANYSIAQDSVKTWSNRAVIDLRKKAAYEYRSASSVTDVGVKRSYLNRAKAYLEEAAQKFPASSNQDTVKENLGMITKELERLQ